MDIKAQRHNRELFKRISFIKSGKELDIVISKIAGDLFPNAEYAWDNNLMPHYSLNTDDAFKLPIPDNFEWELHCDLDYSNAYLNEKGDGSGGVAEILNEAHTNSRAYAICIAWLSYRFNEADRLGEWIND